MSYLSCHHVIMKATQVLEFSLDSCCGHSVSLAYFALFITKFVQIVHCGCVWVSVVQTEHVKIQI